MEEFQILLLECIRTLSEETISKTLPLEPNIFRSLWLEGQAVANGEDEITISKKDSDEEYTVYKFNLTDWKCITTAKNFDDFGIILSQNIIVRLSRSNWKLGFCYCDKFYKENICKHIIGLAIKTGLVNPTQFIRCKTEKPLLNCTF